MGRGQGARKSDAGSGPNLRGSAAEEGSCEGNARHVIKVFCGLLSRRCPEKTAPALFLHYWHVRTCLSRTKNYRTSRSDLRWRRTLAHESRLPLAPTAPSRRHDGAVALACNAGRRPRSSIRTAHDPAYIHRPHIEREEANSPQRHLTKRWLVACFLAQFSLRCASRLVTRSPPRFLTHDGDVARGARMRPRGHSCLWVRPAPLPRPQGHKGRPRRRPRPRGRPQWRRPRLPVPHAGAGRNSSDFSPATMSKPRPGSTSIWKRSSIS